MPDKLNISKMTTSFLVAADIQKRLGDAKLATAAQLAPLRAHAQSLGFTPGKAAKDFFGASQTYEARVPVRGVKSAEFELHVQNLIKSGTKDKLALFVVRVKAGSNEDTYGFILEAPGGVVDKTREWTVQRGKVVLAHSWWSRTKACLKKSCVSACISALATCPMADWTAYLGCLALKCGGCWVKCAACATCNCKIWCRWGVGCCRN